MDNSDITSIVFNTPYFKQFGLPPFYYRYRSCQTNFPNRTLTTVSGFTPAEQFQKLKLIQNTVRIDASQYIYNLGPLTVYKSPINNPSQGLYGVNWNQMSDRPIASVQKQTIPTGVYSAMNKKHTSVTSSKPGSQTPGGVGCDIKHNSYDRYLNRLKGKNALRRQQLPSTFGNNTQFNCANPIYGGKVIKTNVINSCICSNVT